MSDPLPLTPRDLEVLAAIKKADRPITVFELAGIMGERPTTIGNVVKRLTVRDAVPVDHIAPPGRGGRPAAHYLATGWRATWKPRPDVAAAWMFGGSHAA